MTRWIVRPLAALTFVLILLYLGQAVERLHGSERAGWWPQWLQLDIGFVRSLSSEIGGSGLDALLVGWIAGFVIARMDRRHDSEKQRNSLRRRRKLNGQVDLERELNTGAGQLPLAGFTFTSKTIDDCHLSGMRFFEHKLASRLRDLVREPGRPATASLDRVKFLGCQIVRASFGGATGGSTLTLCQFERCAIRKSDFRRVQFISNAGTAPFLDTALTRCRFDGATFVHANLSQTPVRWCSFWGASLEDSQLPSGLYSALREANCIVKDEARLSYYGVVTLRDVLRKPSWKRTRFLLRYLLGARFGERPVP